MTKRLRNFIGGDHVEPPTAGTPTWSTRDR